MGRTHARGEHGNEKQGLLKSLFLYPFSLQSPPTPSQAAAASGVKGEEPWLVLSAKDQVHVHSVQSGGVSFHSEQTSSKPHSHPKSRALLSDSVMAATAGAQTQLRGQQAAKNRVKPDPHT